MILEEIQFWGSILGVAALFGVSTPRLIRLLMPADRLGDTMALSALERAFLAAGLEAPDTWVFRRQRPGFHNAFITSSLTGRRTLFLTPSLLQSLTPPEFEAVMLHEASHIVLGHLRKRMGAVLAAFGLASLGAGFLVMLALFIAPKGTMMLVILAGVATSAWFQNEYVKRAMRRQELEADAHAVSLGASPEALASALKKVTPASAGKRGTHPELKVRLAALSSSASRAPGAAASATATAA